MGTLPSGLPDVVDADEDLARFLTSSRQFNATMAKPAVFLPNSKDKETSVFRHGSEPRLTLWMIGKQHVEAQGRTLRGAAVFKARDVRAALLEVVATEPPPRHASIIDWPWLDDPEQQKAQQKERAAVIAGRSELLLV